MAQLVQQLDADSRARLLNCLSPKQYKQASYQIVKRTTAALTRIIQAKVKELTRLNNKYARRVITASKPSGDPPEAQVVVKKKGIPLIAFELIGSKGRIGLGGVAVDIGNGRLVHLRHAFTASVSSAAQAEQNTGHRGVFARKRIGPPGTPGGLRNEFSRTYRRRKLVAQGLEVRLRRAVTPGGFAERLPIREEFGPSIFTIINVPEVIENITFDAKAFMKKEAQGQLSRFLSQQPIVDAPEPAESE